MSNCPEANIKAHWPLVYAALQSAGQASVRSQAGMIATIAIETASTFTPCRELYNDPPGEYSYFEGMYGIGHHPSAAAMGNTQVGDGARYFGRGFIQITWKLHYQNYGARLGVDMVGNPDLALRADIAARVAALYWADRDIQAKADALDWAGVRRAVQGGTNGLPRLIQIATGLLFG